MKHNILLSILLLICISFNINADEAANHIRIQQVPKGGTHFDLPIPADQPEVYYYSSTQEIIVDGDDGGFVCYYDVEIYPSASAIPIISTQIDGDYDTIDVSSLTAGDFTIIIYSPYNHEFQGEFTIE